MTTQAKFLKDLGFSDEWIAQLGAQDITFMQEQTNYDFAPLATQDVSELIINSNDSPFSNELVM